MAKIPAYKESQRIDAVGPYQAVDPSAAAAQGENIEAMGRQLQGFGNAMMQYKEVKEKTDEAIFAKAWKDRADVLAQDTETSIRTNRDGKVEIDGSNMMQIYDGAFEPLYGEISSIKDPRRRQIAKNAVGIARNVYRGQISEAQIATHNAWMFQETIKSNQTMGAVIATDPTQFENKLNEQKAFLMTLPLGNENKRKLIKDAEDTAALSVISSYQERGDYKTAEKMIQGPLAGFFSAEDRQKLLERNEKEYREEKSFQWTEKERQRELKKEKREDDRIDALESILPNINSDDPEKRDQAVAIAKAAVQSNLISQQDFDNIKKTDFDADYENSDEKALTYWARLERKQNLGSYIDDVLKDGGIKPSTKDDLIKAYSTAKASRKSSALDTFERNKAAAFIEDIYNPEFLDRKTDFREWAANKRRVHAEFIRRMRNGEAPMQAATNAVRKLDPTNYVLAASDRKETISETNLKQEKADIIKSVQRAKERGALTEEKAKKSLLRLKEIEQQMLYLKNKGYIDQSKKDKDGKK